MNRLPSGCIIEASQGKANAILLVITGQDMILTHEPGSPEKADATPISALEWIYVLDDSGLPEGHMAPVYPLGVNVILVRVDGAVYAVSGRCAHMACPLSAGRLEGYMIVCPCHDWRFDVRTGRFPDAPEIGLTVYPTKIEAGKLFVILRGKEMA